MALKNSFTQSVAITMNAATLIRQLNLQPHPEGGYYHETYRAAGMMLNDKGESRNNCTAIYFLLENSDKSHFHRIQSDELWFFHGGASLEIVCIVNGGLHSIVLGNNLEAGEVPQATVPANTWFGSRLKDGEGYALVSCAVAPGFDFSDFEMAEREQLIREFPHLEVTIKTLTR